MEELIEKYLAIASEYDQEYKIDEHNRDAITYILRYFFTKDEDINRRKGIYLYGGYGSGKSLMMLIVNRMLGEDRFYYCKALNIASDFRDNGGQALERYKNMGEIMIDDVGEEETGTKNFGNVSNTIQEVLSVRCDLWQTIGVRTHITSNTPPHELENFYGGRIASRLMGQFHHVLCSVPQDKDRRNTAMPVEVKDESEKVVTEDEKQLIEKQFMQDFWHEPLERFKKTGSHSEFEGEKMHEVFKVLWRLKEISLTESEANEYKEKGLLAAKGKHEAFVWDLRTLEPRQAKLLTEKTEKNTHEWMVRFNSALYFMHDYIIEKAMGC